MDFNRFGFKDVRVLNDIIDEQIFLSNNYHGHILNLFCREVIVFRSGIILCQINYRHLNSELVMDIHHLQEMRNYLCPSFLEAVQSGSST